MLAATTLFRPRGFYNFFFNKMNRKARNFKKIECQCTRTIEKLYLHTDGILMTSNTLLNENRKNGKHEFY